MGLVSTVDVMDPIGEDFYRFGRVAAANSLSDVYAMGGQPLVVLNVVCTPASEEAMERLHQALKGAQEVVVEAGAAIGGGHTTVSEQFKFGLAVTGKIDPKQIVSLGGARPGDRLVLTKPLGTMSIMTGLLPSHPDHPAVQRAFGVMERLNREAARAMVALGAHACTDVTGFGFIGHLSQMMEESGCTAHVQAKQLPVIEGALEHALEHCWDRALNLFSFQDGVRVEGQVDEEHLNVMYEAATSGGLLIAIESKKTTQLLSRLTQEGVAAACVGEVEKSERNIHIVVHA